MILSAVHWMLRSAVIPEKALMSPAIVMTPPDDDIGEMLMGVPLSVIDGLDCIIPATGEISIRNQIECVPAGINPVWEIDADWKYSGGPIVEA